MIPFLPRLLTIALAAAVLVNSMPMAAAQSGPPKPAEQRPPAGQAADAAKERQKADELAEAARLLDGPAGNPECVWLGRRVVSLLWRDDLDTASRHLELYDRFGCPAKHIQSTFRCVLSQGPVDPKGPDSVNSRVHACWITPPTASTPAAASRRSKR
ncbi:MAG: beta-1-3, beta-1-6-glucan biosynthesis protein [Xanthobacteraceae bacterium]